MFRTLAVSLLSLLLCASVAFAEKPLVVASDPTFPPNEMLNKDKEIVGFSIDYIKAVGKEAGFDVQVKNIAWDGIFAALASNQVDVIAASVSITDKRKKAMLFTDPYYELHQAVVLPLGKEIKDEYRDKFHIGLVTGEPEFYGFALRKNDKELAQKLNAGIKAVQEKGIEKQILEKWFGTN